MACPSDLYGAPGQNATRALLVSYDRDHATWLESLLRAAGFVVGSRLTSEQSIDRVLLEARDWLAARGAFDHRSGPVPLLCGQLDRLDVLVVDWSRLSDCRLGLIEQVFRAEPLVEVITISARPEVSAAVQAYRAGVFAALQRPVTDAELVYVVGSAGRRKHRAEQRIRKLDAETWSEPRPAAAPGMGRLVNRPTRGPERPAPADAEQDVRSDEPADEPSLPDPAESGSKGFSQ